LMLLSHTNRMAGIRLKLWRLPWIGYHSYLTYLFANLPNLNLKIHPELLEKFLPWNDEIQKNCK